jgi:hypothetical protein
MTRPLTAAESSPAAGPSTSASDGIESQGSRLSGNPVDELFVSVDFKRDIAYVAYGHSSALHWEELSRANAEVLVAMGAGAQVQLRSGSLISVGATSRWRRLDETEAYVGATEADTDAPEALLLSERQRR